MEAGFWYGRAYESLTTFATDSMVAKVVRLSECCYSVTFHSSAFIGLEEVLPGVSTVISEVGSELIDVTDQKVECLPSLRLRLPASTRWDSAKIGVR